MWFFHSLKTHLYCKIAVQNYIITAKMHPHACILTLFPKLSRGMQKIHAKNSGKKMKFLEFTTEHLLSPEISFSIFHKIFFNIFITLSNKHQPVHLMNLLLNQYMYQPRHNKRVSGLFHTVPYHLKRCYHKYCKHLK